MSEQKNEPQEQDIQVNVLIIAHKQSQYASAASFLSRRGFPCTVKGNIRDGLQFITKNKATHVFLSWNLPGANIIKTFQLITKTLKVECVVFAEKPDGKTAAELTMSRIPEIMQAPVSGPGLAMRLQKLLKAKEDGDNPAATEKKQAQPQSQRSQRRTVKCSNQEVPTDGTWEDAGVDPQDGQPIYRFKSSRASDEDSGTFTFKGPRPPQLDPNGHWDSAAGAYRFESDAKDNSLKSAYSQKQFQDADLGENTDDISDGSLNDISNLLNGLQLEEDAAESAEKQPSQPSFAEGSNPTADPQINPTFSEFTPEESEDTESDLSDKSPKSQRSTPKSYGSVLNFAKKSRKKDSDLPDYDPQSSKEAMILNSRPRFKSNGPASLLAEKVIEALRLSTQADVEIPQKVGIVSEAKAFTIHSPQFNGYLLLASPHQIILNTEMFRTIKQQLTTLLEKVGEKLSNLQELDLDLQSLDFQVWSETYAEFTVSAAHQDSEIICAFVPTVQTLPQVGLQNAQMSKIAVAEVTAETKSKFNIYLYLPKNNKFIRYLRPGDKITLEHTDRFKKHNLEELHIKTEEVQSFKEYYAANKLFDLSKKRAS